MRKIEYLPTERVEDYLETIFQVVKRKKFAQAKDIVENLGVKHSSVTEMFQKMKEKGYINYEKYSGVTLTEKGEAIALEIHRKLQILTDFLIILDINEQTAEEEAFKIQHSMSKNTTEKLIRFVEFVQKSRKSGGWIDHLDYYFETGTYIECSPLNKKSCPVHHRNQKKNLHL